MDYPPESDQVYKGIEANQYDPNERIRKSEDVFEDHVGQPFDNGDRTRSVELKQFPVENDYKTRLEFLAHQADSAVRERADYLEFTDNNYMVGGEDLTNTDMLHLGFEKVGEDAEKHSIWRMQAFNDCVDYPIDNGDGTKTAYLRSIPFDERFKMQDDFVHYQSNLAAWRDADCMEYTLLKDVQHSDLEGKTRALDSLGFRKVYEDNTKSIWRMPVLK